MPGEVSNPWPAQRWARLEEIFTTAAELPPQRRGPFLARACGGDAELRHELESLLAHTGEQDTALQAALQAGAVGVLAESPRPELELGPGSRLGAWRLDRELGRGGMAVVYLASRQGEFEQQAALKLIKRGMDTDAVVARLRRERRILAGLDHPGISRLLDGGSTPAGHPWLALDYVAGEPIDKWCERQAASVAQRCALLARLCEAVAYAHRNLVVHGDLKPGNILVTENGQPKLLDFGIAKLLAPEPEDEGGTRTGAPRPYTPAYASPEQIRGGVLTTASDIYSLGLVAFELLAGARPALPDERVSHAARRAGKDTGWRRALQGDLDTIVNKARAPQAGERYLSAEALAEDLRRYLAGQPIGARRPGLRYRTEKFVGRHRWGTAAGVAILALAATGAGMYVAQARLAARRFDDLRQFANAFLFQVDDQLRDLPNSTAARAVIVEKSIGFLNALALEQRSDANLQHEAGAAWRRVGDLQGDLTQASLGESTAARASYERSLALLTPLARRERGPRREGDARSDLVETYHNYSELERISHNSGRAAALLAAAMPYAQDVGTPPIAALQAQFGRLYDAQAWVDQNDDKFLPARDAARLAVASLTAAAGREPRWRADLADAVGILGAVTNDLGDDPAGVVLFQRNLELRQALAAEHPKDRLAQRNLMLAWAHIADAYIVSPGQIASPQLLTANAQMLATGRAIVALDPSDATARHDLAIALSRVANTNLIAQRFDESLAENREALGLFSALLQSDPADKQLRFYQAFAEEGAGGVELARRRSAEAATWFTAAARHYEMVTASDPRDFGGWYGRLRVLSKLGQAAGEAGQPEVVEASRQEDEALAAALHPEAAGEITRRASPLDAWLRFGNAYAALHDTAKARTYYERSLAGWLGLGALPPAYAGRPAQVRAALAKLSQ